MRQSPLERFKAKIEVKDDCWIWKAQIWPTGYGAFSLDRKSILAHRASWIIYKGDIPEGLCVCHTCDTRACVNPDHLFLGTHKDNIQDMVFKKRAPIQKRSIKESDIEKLYQLYEAGLPQRDIAKMFKINQKTIWRYIHKKYPIKPCYGEGNNKSKLSEPQVLEIRNAYVPYKTSYQKLADAYSVNVSTVIRLINGKTWRRI